MGKAPSRRLYLEGNYTIELNGRKISYQVKRSSRARRVRLEIDMAEGLVVVLPRSFPHCELAPVLVARKGWICRHMDSRAAAAPVPDFENLDTGISLPYMGKQIRLIYDGSERTAKPYCADCNLVVQSGCGNGKLAAAVEQWYRVQARDILARKTEYYGGMMGLSPEGIAVRGQRTLWGSCSRKGKLSFNWKLLMAPEPVIDYVVVHELAHLRQLNHGRSFWALVADYCPGWRRHRQWLRENGSLLKVRMNS